MSGIPRYVYFTHAPVFLSLLPWPEHVYLCLTMFVVSFTTAYVIFVMHYAFIYARSNRIFSI